MKLNRFIVPTLAIITALESLSIDLYLPAFSQIAGDLNSSIGNVQISVSLFLCGFAVGQLLWGPLSDRHGRKPILLIGLAVFIISSFAISFAHCIELLWVLRFLQSFGGCAGIVMSRAIVADVFSKDDAIKIFATQSQISGIAPIIAPLIGSLLLNQWGWKSIFFILSIMGALCVGAVIKWVPETNGDKIQGQGSLTNESNGSLMQILMNKKFLLYTMIGAMAYSSLMIYISSAPFVLITKAGLSETIFSLVFGINSIALIFASYITPKLSKAFKAPTVVLGATIVLLIISSISVGFSLNSNAIIPTIIMLFLSLIPIGILFPITTALALETVTHGKGKGAALMGFSQLMLSFLFSALTGLLQHNSVWPIEFMRLLVSLFAFLLAITGIRSARKFLPKLFPGFNNALKNQKMNNETL